MNELIVLMQEWEDAEHTINYCRREAVEVLKRECEARHIGHRKIAIDTNYDVAYVGRVFKGEDQPSTRFMLAAMAALKNEPLAVERLID